MRGTKGGWYAIRRSLTIVMCSEFGTSMLCMLYEKKKHRDTIVEELRSEYIVPAPICEFFFFQEQKMRSSSKNFQSKHKYEKK